MGTSKTSFLDCSKDLQTHKYLQIIGYNEDTLLHMEQYSIKSVYKKMRRDGEKVKWRKLVWINYRTPKWLFMSHVYSMQKYG